MQINKQFQAGREREEKESVVEQRTYLLRPNYAFDKNSLLLIQRAKSEKETRELRFLR